jgi:T5SS/PEP-CTERM-associated repeat protein
MAKTYYWFSRATKFGLASSWSPSGGPPTASDTANINVAASISGTGTAEILNIDAAGVAISGPLTTTIAQTRMGTTAAGSVTVGSDWNLENGSLNLGATYAGALTIGAGGDVTNVFGLTLGSVSGAQGTLTIEDGGQLSDDANDKTKFDVIGDAAGSSGAAAVEGSGSNWTSTGEIDVGDLGKGSLTVKQRRQHRRAESDHWQ